MPQLQGMGNGEATAQLRGGLKVLSASWLLLHGVLAAAGTWLARRYAVRKQLLDQPGERRSHSVATPRGGGIAIVGVMLTSLGWLGLRYPGQGLLLACFAMGLLLVAGIGWLDDHRPISPWPRLLVHCLAAAIFAWGLHQATGSLGASVLAFGSTIVLTNIWNFMDGIDGLAASQAGIVALALALTLGGPFGLLAAALGAAVLGFLPFNFPKARIFLGDVGSGALGFVLAALGSLAAFEGSVAPMLLLLPLAAFLVDAAFTLSMRILRHERWWAPHVQHTYQRWAARRKGHVLVTLAYAGFSFSGVILMQLGLGWQQDQTIGICVVWYLGAGVLWARMRRDVSIEKDAQQ